MEIPVAKSRIQTGGSTQGDSNQQMAVPRVNITPRLFDLETAAAYLGVSPWTVRDLEAAGVLSRVRVPLPDGRDLRKLLFDKEDLDRLIEAWKDSV